MAAGSGSPPPRIERREAVLPVPAQPRRCEVIGEVTSFDVLEKYVTPELACVVWVERSKAKAGGRQEVLPFDLRVTMILRPEEGTWKVVHRHADSMTMAQPIKSVIQE